VLHCQPPAKTAEGAPEGRMDKARYPHITRTWSLSAAANAGISERSIMAQTGHRSLKTVRRYIREGSLFRENAATKVGL
jgi:hypothetical protein